MEILDSKMQTKPDPVWLLKSDKMGCAQGDIMIPLCADWLALLAFAL